MLGSPNFRMTFRKGCAQGPEASLSATIQAFSSSVQRRRRPTPVITSSRRKPSSLVPVVVP